MHNEFMCSSSAFDVRTVTTNYAVQGIYTVTSLADFNDFFVD